MTRNSRVGNHGQDKPTATPKPLGKGFDAAFRGYINVTLSDDQKSTFDAWSSSASPLETLEFVVSDGVNISLKWDVKGACYLASGTQRREDSPNAGLVVTARAAEAWKAWYRLLFTLAYLGRKEKWEDTQPLANPDRW